MRLRNSLVCDEGKVNQALPGRSTLSEVYTRSLKLFLKFYDRFGPEKRRRTGVILSDPYEPCRPPRHRSVLAHIWGVAEKVANPLTPAKSSAGHYGVQSACQQVTLCTQVFSRCHKMWKRCRKRLIERSGLPVHSVLGNCSHGTV